MSASNITKQAVVNFRAQLAGYQDPSVPPALITLDDVIASFSDSPPGPVSRPPPESWRIDSSKTYRQKFGRDFAAGTGGNRELNVLTTYDESSPSLAENTVHSFKFQVGVAGQPTCGHFGGITGSRGGTPWFFISQGAPSDLSLLVEDGKFSYRAATVSTGYLAWMVAGAPLPAGAFPDASKRVALAPGRDYWLNIVFCDLQALINANDQRNTCQRPAGNPSSWECQARFIGRSST